MQYEQNEISCAYYDIEANFGDVDATILPMQKQISKDEERNSGFILLVIMENCTFAQIPILIS